LLVTTDDLTPIIASSQLTVVTNSGELCERYDVTAKYVQLILRLNFLAPKLKEAILFGEQPRHLKLSDLMNNVPVLWSEQQEVFGLKVLDSLV
jgi:hypothetical protein